jgi:hypothetical protein
MSNPFSKVLSFVPGVLVITFISLGIYTVMSRYELLSYGIKERSDAVLGEQSTPTLYPFQELTIPYLRSRSYDSDIAELVKHEDKETYTSHLHPTDRQTAGHVNVKFQVAS